MHMHASLLQRLVRSPALSIHPAPPPDQPRSQPSVNVSAICKTVSRRPPRTTTTTYIRKAVCTAVVGERQQRRCSSRGACCWQAPPSLPVWPYAQSRYDVPHTRLPFTELPCRPSIPSCGPVCLYTQDDPDPSVHQPFFPGTLRDCGEHKPTAALSHTKHANRCV